MGETKTKQISPWGLVFLGLCWHLAASLPFSTEFSSGAGIKPGLWSAMEQQIIFGVKV